MNPLVGLGASGVTFSLLVRALALRKRGREPVGWLLAVHLPLSVVALAASTVGILGSLPANRWATVLAITLACFVMALDRRYLLDQWGAGGDAAPTHSDTGLRVFLVTSRIVVILMSAVGSLTSAYLMWLAWGVG